ncbi:substrate-binding domain-containing protein [Methylobacterium aquaticum]|uniref:substrate-binding domain-containing protein n=1 Tax=Methylobacterium aquaticum TaxID=270351 RepID=UPI001931A8FD|nr:substrate-binding domain-containing protein [Methylobacterium aquaticum]QRE76087.1 autoinducer 2 ABC transporter substrate-binding protein [Methylobacterium aquaticum]
MDRRTTLKMLGGLAVAGPLHATRAFAAAPKTMATVVKAASVPWFNILNQGLEAAGKQFDITTTMVGPAQVDPAQQVKLIDDLIAKKVDVIGLVPLDVKVTAQAVKRARDAGIVVITQEGENQDGKTWDLELISAKNYGEMQMKALAREMGEEGDYVVYVGTLTTPGHNSWADAAIAYQKAHYPKMRMVADRFPGADLIDESSRVTQQVLQTYPDVRGILSMGSNGPIGAGNVIKQRRLEKKIAVVGTIIPAQAQALLMSGAIREGFLWNPKDAGYGMVAIARMVLDGTPIKTGTEIPTLGPATVDEANRVIQVDRVLTINKTTVGDLVKQGL